MASASTDVGYRLAPTRSARQRRQAFDDQVNAEDDEEGDHDRGVVDGEPGLHFVQLRPGVLPANEVGDDDAQSRQGIVDRLTERGIGVRPELTRG
jgi:hypothetical protein